MGRSASWSRRRCLFWSLGACRPKSRLRRTERVSEPRRIAKVRCFPRIAAFETSSLRRTSGVGRLPLAGTLAHLAARGQHGVVQQAKTDSEKRSCRSPRSIRTWCSSRGQDRRARTAEPGQLRRGRSARRPCDGPRLSINVALGIPSNARIRHDSLPCGHE
jgi:hypothetical protein